MLTFANNTVLWDITEMKTSSKKLPSLAEYTDTLQSQGKYWFTKQEAVAALRVSAPAFNKAAHRLAKNTKIARIKNGFYTIVPPEFRQAKGLPPPYYIDALMKYVGQPYYIGVLSAASLHGASHQAPQETQVVTSKPLKMIEIGKNRIHFVTKKDIQLTPTVQIKTPTGFMQSSSRAATIVDLLRYVRIAGHLDNVTTVLAELIEDLNIAELMKIAKNEIELSNFQRLGFLLDKFSLSKTISRELSALISKRKPGYVFLRPDKREGVIEKNHKWNILVNTEVEPDL
jgi:predicted transcriptional regulator of viral defense system